MIAASKFWVSLIAVSIALVSIPRDSSPARLVFDAPTTYDEFVIVLKGELILTDNAGNAVTYKAGEMFMLKKGFLGTWEMTEDYRELIVVDTEAYNES